MIQDFSLVPRRAVRQGPGTFNETRFESHSAFVCHQLAALGERKA